jgi:hypothetical protein
VDIFLLSPSLSSTCVHLVLSSAHPPLYIRLSGCLGILVTSVCIPPFRSAAMTDTQRFVCSGSPDEGPGGARENVPPRFRVRERVGAVRLRGCTSEEDQHRPQGGVFYSPHCASLRYSLRSNRSSYTCCTTAWMHCSGLEVQVHHMDASNQPRWLECCSICLPTKTQTQTPEYELCFPVFPPRLSLSGSVF